MLPLSKYVCPADHYSMSSVFILMGSNLGDRTMNLNKAIAEIESKTGEILKMSGVYKTAAWGKRDQPDFYNQVIEIDTVLPPLKLLEAVLSIELEMGRVRQEKWGERLIDIDILLYDFQVVNLPELRIPHPQMQLRRFTLLPLAEIAPELIEPISGKTIQELLEQCPDQLPVERL